MVDPQFIASAITILIALQLMLLSCAYLIFFERKVAAWVQNRIGPNRVGFSFGVLPFKHHCWGLGQALIDGLKLLLKEDYNPLGVDRTLFFLAPAVVMIPALLGWAVIPWGGYLQWGDATLNITAASINIGVIYILAIGSLAVYGVVLGGYASNNKYSFLGGLRATAQMLSYEIPMGLCVLAVILMFGSPRADALVAFQANGVWNLFTQPVLAVIFFTCVLAECNRAPFDLAECEQELIGGYHTEYSSMKWALYFLGEYIHMITGSAFFVLLFLGGWDLPILNEPVVGGLGLVALKATAYIAKVAALLFLMMWIRWTLPRFRFDQLMRLAWRGLIPITLALLLATGVLVYLKQTQWWALLIANLVVGFSVWVLGPAMPQATPVNRRVPLPGSRFSPLEAVEVAQPKV